ncbi:lysophospholipid acyltransferase family protein [Gordonia sp. CPCC 206044]|uniref:lysophospholipid acyltransferase family protein n=1 Tax=Gordonia sp. CPCC 206044 TaxID=3140793 RepID=UPI003AF390D8
MAVLTSPMTPALHAPPWPTAAPIGAPTSTSTPGVDPVHHAWYPLSPCGASCFDDELPRGAGRVLVAARMARLIATMLTLAILGPLIALGPRMIRRRFLSRAARGLLRALGVTVMVDDLRPFPGRMRGLVVANHISFLDILALAVICPAHFVAKSDIAAMPVVSGLARRLGIITIDRAALRELPGAVRTAVDGLHRDSSVAVFPEGTTRCGREPGRFRPAFFQAAIDAGVPVLPVRLRFATAGGVTTTAPSFIGTDTPAHTLRRVLRMRGLTVHIRVHEMQIADVDRRTLAARCERIIAA